MKISELKKCDDFAQLIEISRRMVQSYEDYDYMKADLEDRLFDCQYGKPLAVARQIYAWSESYRNEQEVPHE